MSEKQRKIASIMATTRKRNRRGQFQPEVCLDRPLQDYWRVTGYQFLCPVCNKVLQKKVDEELQKAYDLWEQEKIRKEAIKLIQEITEKLKKL